MCLAAVACVVLVACHLGKASVIRPSREEPVDAQVTPSIRTNRCLGDPLQSIRKSILDSMNLQTEPQLSMPVIDQVRDHWINMFKSSNDSEATPLQMTGNISSHQENSTPPQCCKLVSQIFMKDLGWDQWIIYPQSFTYIQCSLCDLQGKIQCTDDDPSALDPAFQKPCCEATLHDHVPFLYLDDTSSLVITSVPLTSECGCSHGGNPQDPNP